MASSKRIKVAVIGHREGSKRARAHSMIRAMRRKPRQEVLKTLRQRLRVTPATAATWYSSMKNAQSRVH